MWKHIKAFWIIIFIVIFSQGCYSPLVQIQRGMTEYTNPVDASDESSEIFTTYSVKLIPIEPDFGFALLPGYTNHKSDFLTYEELSVDLSLSAAMIFSTEEVVFIDTGFTYGQANVVGGEFIGKPNFFTGILDRFEYPDQKTNITGFYYETGYNGTSGFGFSIGVSARLITLTGRLTENNKVSENHEETILMGEYMLGITYLF
jgi:hypothetical protein